MHDKLATWWDGVSLRTKVTGVTVLLLTFGLMVAGVGTTSFLRAYLVEEVDAKISTQLAELRKDQDFIDVNRSTNTVTCVFASVPTDYFIGITDALGEPQCANRGGGIPRPDVQGISLLDVAKQQNPMTVDDVMTSAEWRVAATVFTIEGLPDSYNLIVGYSLKDSDSTIARFIAIFLFFAFTVVVLGGALTRLLVTTTFGPLREVEATAARFAEGDFSQRMSGAPPNTEVGRLNRSLNAMLARIDTAFADRARTIEQMRRFVGDASHELRTPLVSVRGYAELYRMGALQKDEDVAQAMQRIEKEAVRMGELVEDLLELARLDEARPMQFTEVDLVPIARDAALDAMAQAPDRQIDVTITLDASLPDDALPPSETDAATGPIEEPPPSEEPASQARGGRGGGRTASRIGGRAAPSPIALAGATLARLRTRRGRGQKVEEVSLDPAIQTQPVDAHAVVWATENKIRQVVTNLLGNALRFTNPGSPIEIGVEADAARGVAIISIIDHGEGIPPQVREKIFQRFWRADTSRTRETGGSGLGLAIVAAIVRAHNGTVDVVETPGGGATFRVSLPLVNRATTGASSTELPEPEAAPTPAP